MTIITHYHILGVSSDASTEEIESAYRKKAKQWHPDVCRHPDAEERMREINEAAEILCDPRRRRKYDAALSRATFTENKTWERTWKDHPEQSRAPHEHHEKPSHNIKPRTKNAKGDPWISPGTIRFAAGFCAAAFVLLALVAVMIAGLNSLPASQTVNQYDSAQKPATSTVSQDGYLQSIEQGNDLFDAGDYEGAIRVYDTVIEQNPGIALKDVWYNRGLALNILGRYREASQSFDRAIVTAPEDFRILGQKGAALIGLGRYEESLDYTDRALVQNSDTAWIWNNRGVALMNLGQPKEARAAFDNAGVLEGGAQDIRTMRDLVRRVVG